MKTAKRFTFKHFLLILSVLLLACLLPILYRRNPIVSADESFLNFTNNLFCREVSSNTLTLHYTLANPSSYGISEPKTTFGNYAAGSAGHEAHSLQETLNQLTSFPYDQLNADNQLTYDILKTQLEAQIALAPYGLYEEVFTPTIGTHAQLPILLAEYPFDTLNDVDIYLNLLEQLPSYYNSLLFFEQEKAAAGLFMWEDTAQRVITQCQAFLANPQEHFLLTTFEDRIQNLPFISQAQKDAYLKSNEACVANYVIPAYEMLIRGLEDLNGKGKNAQGLFYYRHGRDYYQALITATIGSHRTVPEIRDLLEERIHIDYEIISDILHENPKLSTKTASHQAEIQNSDSALASLTLSSRMLEVLKQRMTSDFPLPSQAECQVKQVHPSMEQHLSPAFYLTPRLDDTNCHTIYINNSTDFDSLSLFTTLAHEGYPGHLYQSLWENTNTPNPVLSLFYFGGYSEGWATYAERMSYSYAGLDPDLAELLAANNSISLAIHALADIGVHYEGWSFAKTADFLSDYGITTVSAAQNIYQAVLEAPANYLKYYLGYVEFELLKTKANAALRDSFELKDFHSFLLSTGPAPFPVLETYLQKWIKEQV